MLIMPELAVALRRELRDAVERHFSDVVSLSTWGKARPARAAVYAASFQRALQGACSFVLWPKGTWATATIARERIGGELSRVEDLESVGQIWLFDSIVLPSTIKKRFTLPSESRAIGRILLPIVTAEGAPGAAMGYLFRSGPLAQLRDGMPFLRLLPELSANEFLVDPHVNFVAARRFLERNTSDVTPPALRSDPARILLVKPGTIA